jgi:hypothetical protein
MTHLERDVLASGELAAIVDRIAARELDPYTASSDLLSRALRSSPSPDQLPNPTMARLPHS